VAELVYASEEMKASSEPMLMLINNPYS